MFECKVRMYHFEDHGDNGIIKHDDYQERKVNIVFNKTFYAPVGFVNEFTNSYKENMYNKPITKDSLIVWETLLNDLIKRYEKQDLLLLEDPKKPCSCFGEDENYCLY